MCVYIYLYMVLGRASRPSPPAQLRWRRSKGFRVQGFEGFGGLEEFKVECCGLKGSGFERFESGPLWVVHFSRHEWPGRLVN